MTTAQAFDSVQARLPGGLPFPSQVPAGGVPFPFAGQGQPGEGAPGGVSQPGAAGGMARLGPELRDPRLVVQPQAIPERQLSREEVYELMFAARIQALRDSLSGETERRRRGQDWTFTDRNGRRWGVDNGTLVVGNTRIPLPQPPPPSREREEEIRTERQQREEIDRQAEDIERERYLRERGRVIREREDERRRNQRDSTPP